MLKAKVLVDFPFAYLDLTIYVNVTSVSVVDLNFNPPSWHGWMKLFSTTVNWILSAMTFSISLPSVFNRTIEQNIFA